MEEQLAREMAKMKMEKEKQGREIDKICAESPELRELQNKIKNAYLNKERASQVTEAQFRKQVEVVSYRVLFSLEFLGIQFETLAITVIFGGLV
jgi:very-short-patch-repair endonuclease